MNGSSGGDIRDPPSFSTDAPLSEQWMWLVDEIDYASKRFPMFLDKDRDMFFAEKIIAVFRIIDPASHAENLVRGGYRGLAESSRGNEEKSGIVYAVGIALTYWDICQKAPAYAEKFYQQALDYPSAFGMVLSYVFVFVREYAQKASARPGRRTEAAPRAASAPRPAAPEQKKAPPPTGKGADVEKQAWKSAVMFVATVSFTVLAALTIAAVAKYYEYSSRARAQYTATTSGTDGYPFSNLSSNPGILEANRILAEMRHSVSNPPPPTLRTNHPPASAAKKDASLITLPGGFSAKLPNGYRVSSREPSYIEISDEDGAPSIFISQDTLNETETKLLNAVDDAGIAIKIFKRSQEKIEDKKTKLMAMRGSASKIIKWGTPYTLEGVACPAWGIDYMRHDKHLLLHFEARAICANIMIVNGSRMYQINIKHIVEPETPTDTRLPKPLLDFIDSFAVSAPSPTHNPQPSPSPPVTP